MFPSQATISMKHRCFLLCQAPLYHHPLWSADLPLHPSFLRILQYRHQRSVLIRRSAPIFTFGSRFVGLYRFTRESDWIVFSMRDSESILFFGSFHPSNPIRSCRGLPSVLHGVVYQDTLVGDCFLILHSRCSEAMSSTCQEHRILYEQKVVRKLLRQ